MCNVTARKKLGYWTYLLTFIPALMVLMLPLSSVTKTFAATPEWYRLHTNSVPYEPQNLALDPAGGLWINAVDGTEYPLGPDSIEYAVGVWYRPPGAAATPAFQYITNNANNNRVGASYNPPVVKPQLDATVLYAIKDKYGHTWYALKNRTVMCQKSNGDWLTFDMPDSSDIQPFVNTTNVDSAHRIRLIDKPDGSQEKLLIASRGILRVGADFTVLESRKVYSEYNNYFIRDALIDSHGTYWVTSEAGLEKGTSLTSTIYVKDITPVDPSAPAADTTISRIVEDSLGNIWFGSDFGYNVTGIYRYSTAGGWTKFNSGVVADIGIRVLEMAAGNNGAVWFGGAYSGAGGILKFVPDNGGQWTRYTQADLGLQSGAIPGLAVDGAGLWFTTAYSPAVPGNGTGVHYLNFSTGQMTHYTYRGDSTTLTNLRFQQIAADMSGGLWFPSYDAPSISRLKADGTWQQFRQDGTGSFGEFGVVAAAADSRNRVYFAPLRSAPLAYDVVSEQWLNLPAAPFSDLYYYGVYVDPQDGKWFYGAYGVYYLNPDNSAWTTFSPAALPGFPLDYFVNEVLVDDVGNTWFMCRYEIVLMKKNPAGGDPTWFLFTNGDASGYTGGYRVFQDDSGQIWNGDKKRFNSATNHWDTVADTTPFDQRHLRFLNGRVPVTMDMSAALSPATLNATYMTVDTRGAIYFAGGLGSVNAGIVALGPQALPTVTVTATASGTGTGTVGSSPSGINYTYNSSTSGAVVVTSGATVVLTATASGGSTAAWGDCVINGGVAGGTTSVATCTLNNVAAAKSVAATFALKPTLTVSLGGTGGGSIFSTPEGIDCPAPSCSSQFSTGSTVTLTAVPDASSTFSSWSGCTSATGTSCSVTMGIDNKTVTATFNAARAQIGTTGYPTLAAAYAAAGSGAQILLVDGNLGESFTVTKNVTLKGGYNAGFTGLTGLFTNLSAPLTISAGTLTVDRLAVK